MKVKMKNPIYIENISHDIFKITLNVYNDDSYDMSFEEDYITISNDNKCIYAEIICKKFGLTLGSETSESFLVDKYGVERFISKGLENKRFDYEINSSIEKSIKKLKLLYCAYKENFLNNENKNN